MPKGRPSITSRSTTSSKEPGLRRFPRIAAQGPSGRLRRRSTDEERVHRLLSAVVITSTFGVAGLADQSSTSIVGTWKVVKYEDRGPDGTLSYHTVRIQSATSVRRHWPLVGAHRAYTRAEELSRNARGDRRRRRVPRGIPGLRGVFGTYTVDATKGTVTHHVEGSLRPDYTGTDRYAHFGSKEIG